jgi:hypothetical protein
MPEKCKQHLIRRFSNNMLRYEWYRTYDWESRDYCMDKNILFTQEEFKEKYWIKNLNKILAKQEFYLHEIDVWTI